MSATLCRYLGVLTFCSYYLFICSCFQTPLIRSPTGTITIDGNLRLTGGRLFKCAQFSCHRCNFRDTWGIIKYCFCTQRAQVQVLVPRGRFRFCQPTKLWWTERSSGLSGHTTTSSMPPTGGVKTRLTLLSHSSATNVIHPQVVFLIFWMLAQISSCARGEQSTDSDYFLGGHCNFANTNVSKTYTNLPPHTHVSLFLCLCSGGLITHRRSWYFLSCACLRGFTFWTSGEARRCVCVCVREREA